MSRMELFLGCNLLLLILNPQVIQFDYFQIVIWLLIHFFFFEGLDSQNLGEVILTSGEHIQADIVIIGVGARPATDFLRNSEIALDKDGGISVNSFLQV